MEILLDHQNQPLVTSTIELAPYGVDQLVSVPDEALIGQLGCLQKLVTQVDDITSTGIDDRFASEREPSMGPDPSIARLN